MRQQVIVLKRQHTCSGYFGYPAMYALDYANLSEVPDVVGTDAMIKLHPVIISVKLEAKQGLCYTWFKGVAHALVVN